MSPLLQTGLNLTAIGMGVVFVLLTSLVVIIHGMSALCRRIERSLPAAPPMGQVAAGGTRSSLPRQELVAAISAAVRAHRKHRQGSRNE